MTPTEVEECLKRVACGEYNIRVYHDAMERFVCVRLDRPVIDIVTGLKGPLMTDHQLSREFVDYLNEKGLLDLVIRWIEEMEIHEAREQFKYHGARIFNPHKVSA